jgi:Mn-dependent DtxR family transcriptional regulator
MTDKELEELQNIRRLLMLLLYKIGAKQGEVAMALGQSQSTVSEMLPIREVEPAEVRCLDTKKK